MNDVGQMTQYSDEAVVAGILEGAPALYEILIRRYNPYLYKIGRSYGYNHDDTEDLMQETYLNAYANLSKFEKRSTFKTWLVRIMMNQCNQKRQKKSFQYETASDILPEINTQPMFTDHRSETGSQVINKELGSIIERSVQSIPENYRRVFLLRELTGLSVQETADLLGISESNVKEIGRA